MKATMQKDTVALPDCIISLEGIIIGNSCVSTIKIHTLMSRMPTGNSKRTPIIHLHLPIPQFPMSFISMDLLGPY